MPGMPALSDRLAPAGISPAGRVAAPGQLDLPADSWGADLRLYGYNARSV